MQVEAREDAGGGGLSDPEEGREGGADEAVLGEVDAEDEDLLGRWLVERGGGGFGGRVGGGRTIVDGAAGR